MIMEMEDIQQQLSNIVMNSEWEKVIQSYFLHPQTHKAKITESGDTALHIAVSDGDVSTVEQLVDLVSPMELGIQNERGDTPLHVAASMGNMKMCKCIASKDPSLVGIPNKDKETPLFLAAIRGDKNAFLCLHYIITPTEESHPCYTFCRRENGETILHCAIAREYYDLSFQIIHLYRDLVFYVDEEGNTPLHLLASTPNAFNSGRGLGLWKGILYSYLNIDELKVETKDRFYDHKHEEVPNTFLNFMRVFCYMAQVFNISAVCNDQRRGDEETSVGVMHGIPHQCNTCFFRFIVKLLSRAMKLIVVVLLSTLIGSRHMKKIKEEKEKNIWAVQIMDELLHRAYEYTYENNGMKPQTSTPHKDETMPHNNSNGGDEIALGRNGLNPQKAAPSISQKDDETAISWDYEEGDNQNIGWLDSLPPEVTEKTTPEMAKKERSILIVAKKILELFPEVKEKKTPEIAKKETPILIAAKKILERFPDVIGKKTPEMAKKETPILIAAKNGVTEMVEKILELFPRAIRDTNAEKKNVVMLAVENRQVHVYQLLLMKKNIPMEDNVFKKVDNQGNSVLHLAARLEVPYKPWLILGPALQMQWEIKWYQFVAKSKPDYFFASYNKDNMTANDIFTTTHSKLVEDGGVWLNKASESCSFIGALVATVAFATATQVPGGIKESTGKPNLYNQPAFDVFSIASLVALCSSLTSMVIFLTIIMSRCQQKDFEKDLPVKFVLGVTTLFLSIVAMLVSFCAGHFFTLKDKFNDSSLAVVYFIACMPLALFTSAHFPRYCRLIWANFKDVPFRSPSPAPGPRHHHHHSPRF